MFRLSLTLAALSFAVPALAAEKPNVLIVMTDDQGLGDFSYTGNPVLKTPNLDRFAKESVRFTDFHVCPMCSPTRGQLLTGVAAVRNGVTSVTAGRTFLRPGLPTMPEVFAAAGYKTGLFGKWHLGDHYPHRPIDKGFQEAIYHHGWGMLHSTADWGNELIDGHYYHNGEPKKFTGHCTDVWFDTAMAWMKERKEAGEPFFCYLPTNTPHTPHIELKKYVGPYVKGKGPAPFFGMISHIDQRFGDLDKFLTDSGLRDNTIVVFMTDNGGTAGVNVFNAGLRGRKTMYYEGGHRVPCWIRWPNGKLGGPRDIDVPTQNTDLLPTLVELCDIPAPKNPALPADEVKLYGGVSLLPLFQGSPRRIADRMFVVQYGQIPERFDCCVVWGKWRLVKGTELYDVHADRAQENDVAAKNPDVVKAMRDHYEAWWKGVEPLVTEFVPISIGAKQQPVVELNSGDWENIYADNCGHVQRAVGGPTGGHWNIDVVEAGEYEFTLRCWPEQSKGTLGGTGTVPAGGPKGKTETFPTIAKGRLQVADVNETAPADPKSEGVTLTAKLPAGSTKLKAWFQDSDGKDLCGAFFVTVKRK